MAGLPMYVAKYQDEVEVYKVSTILPAEGKQRGHQEAMDLTVEMTLGLF